MWRIASVDRTVSKKLEKYKANKQLTDNYFKFIEDLANADDPRKLGDPKQGRFRQCFGKHMTKSHSLIYYVDFERRTVYLIDLDDHKNLYGRDNRV